MKRKTSDIASASGLKNGPPVLSGSHRRNPHQEKESASPVSSQEAEGDLPHTQRTEAEAEEMWPQVKKFQQPPEAGRGKEQCGPAYTSLSDLNTDFRHPAFVPVRE